MQRHIAGGGTHLVLRRRLVAQQFLDGGGNLAAVVAQLLPLVGKVREGDDRVADQLGDGFRARAAEQCRKSGNVDVGQLLHLSVAFDLGLDEPADHVVLWRGAPALE